MVVFYISVLEFSGLIADQTATSPDENNCFPQPHQANFKFSKGHKYNLTILYCAYTFFTLTYHITLLYP